MVYMDKENIGLAKEHADLAEEIVLEESKKDVSDENKEKLGDAAFSLEKAEADLEEVEKSC